MKPTAEELRAEADRIEAEELKAERMKTADKVPTCPECGGRSFEIAAWTTVSQSISFEDDEESGDWDDDYQSGDHGETNASASCNDCGADVAEMLTSHGWTFYADPEPIDPNGDGCNMPPKDQAVKA